MKTKEIEIEFNGKKDKVIMKSLTWGEYNRLIEEATDIKFIGNQPVVKVNTTKMRELGVFKCLVQAPFDISDITNVQKLDKEIGEKLYSIFEELNSEQAKKED